MAIYNLINELVRLLLPVFGRFDTKLKKGIDGRQKTFEILQKYLQKGDEVFWFHCASLGEYEQGLPVFEQLKAQNPKTKIVLSFFSPSGYEIRKENPLTPIAVYLPLDTKKQVQKFLELTHPKLVVFVKYELWPNYLKALKNHPAKVVLISALLRPDQYFFKFYGKQWKHLFFSFDYIFTQNIESKKLLQNIGYHDVTIAKDTRFDRVSNQLKQNNTLPFIEEFKDGKLCVVAGSTWFEDEQVLIPYIQNAPKSIKFIIAPHLIQKQNIRKLKEALGYKAVLYSNFKEETLAEKQVFIVDTIGLLSKVYSYADVAYIGGGMGTSGLHNTLEAAVFGIPIVIGKNYQRFPEAKEMLQNGGLVSIKNSAGLKNALDRFITDEKHRENCGQKNGVYVANNKGASAAILEKVNFLLKD
ncbi:MAG: 3-deoxy-D-manno-octulosonic acid transferase [Flavobacteriaceae bacterium]